MPSSKTMSFEEFEKEIFKIFPPGQREEVLAQVRSIRQQKLWAHQKVRDTIVVPTILYKYASCDLLQKGFPSCLRATQPTALNDVMECNITTLKDPETDEAKWREALLEGLTKNFGISMPPEELERRRRIYADPRISTVIQNYLDRFVGVVSFTTDPLITTMWAHYAQNSGFVVGYNAEVLRTLGFELRKMLYLELPPMYDPVRDNIIRVWFVDEEMRKRRMQEGIQSSGTPILETVDFLELQRDWKTLAQLLFVKGKSWEYEKEVRLLVGQQDTRLLEKKDKNGLPIRVLDIPPEAIEEVYVGFNTPQEDYRKMIELVGERKQGWKMMHTSSHAYRMQVTATGVY